MKWLATDLPWSAVFSTHPNSKINAHVYLMARVVYPFCVKLVYIRGNLWIHPK